MHHTSIENNHLHNNEHHVDQRADIRRPGAAAARLEDADGPGGEPPVLLQPRHQPDAVDPAERGRGAHECYNGSLPDLLRRTGRLQLRGRVLELARALLWVLRSVPGGQQIQQQELLNLPSENV